MSSIKNSNVTRELQKLLLSLKESSPAEYNILMNLIEEVYEDPKIHLPEASSNDIENKLLQWINTSVNSSNK